MKFRFKGYKVYQEAKDYCKFSREIINRHINNRDRGLNDQLTRALNSIVLNIAEGSADHSDVEFTRFLSISIRSIYETVAGFDLATLYGFIDEDFNLRIEDRPIIW